MLRVGQPLPDVACVDVHARPVPSGGPALWVFTGPATSPQTHLALARVRALPIPVVVVVPSPAEAVARLPEIGVMIPDHNGELGRRFAMGRDRFGRYTLTGLVQGRIEPVALRALGALRPGPGAWRRLPAEVLIDAHRQIRWLHLACTLLELPPIAEMQRAIQELAASVSEAPSKRLT